MQETILTQIEAIVKDLYEQGCELAQSGANTRSLIEFASGCYWSLVNMQHAAVFAGDCNTSALYADAAQWWLAETMGL